MIEHIKQRFSIRFTLIGIFILATSLIASIVIGLQYHFSHEMLADTSRSQYQTASQNISRYFSQLAKEAKGTTQLLAKFQHTDKDGKLTTEALTLFADVMRSNPLFYAIYLGHENGDLSELINLDSHPMVRQQLGATHVDRWVTIFISGVGEQRTKRITYLDEQFKPRAERIEPSSYSTTNRPWFFNAKPKQVTKTDPYLFQNLQAPGITFSTQTRHSPAVIAVDIALSSLNKYLIDYTRHHNKQGQLELFIFQPKGEIIASNQIITNNNLPPVAPLTLTESQQALIAEIPTLNVSNENDWAPIDFSIAGQPKGYSIDTLTLISQMTGLQFKFVNGFSWSELITKFTTNKLDLIHSIILTEQNQPLGKFSDPYLDLPYSVVTMPDSEPITDIEQLNGKQLAIPKGWSIIPFIKQYYPQIEIVEMNSTHEVLQAVEDQTVHAALDIGIILHYTATHAFIDKIQFHDEIKFGTHSLPTQLHILLKNEYEQLIPIINLALANITPQQKAALKQKWFTTKKRLHSERQNVPYQELIELASDAESQAQLQPYTINGIDYFFYVSPISKNDSNGALFAAIIPVETLFAPAVKKVTYSISITILFALLLLPLSWLFATLISHPIHLLEAENKKIKQRQYSQVKKVNTRIVELDELSNAMLSMSESIQAHELAQKELMESFIKLIAQAIDDKSPYTAGHCNRVPELGLMLAQKAHESQLKPFKEFSFKSEDEHREFRIAAWLHDCGKITTPEYIVDKGSKLEAVYNRIHEIRMRFEVLLRDAQITYYQSMNETPDDKALHQKTLEDKQQQLTDDFTFIATANIGGEFMEQTDIERLHQLAKITWTRHFDDTLGLSPIEELKIKQLKRKSTLPATEQLLSDKKEHIIKRTQAVKFDPALKIKIPVPENQYNLGEIYNLSITRGTLTTEDRYKINEHVISTIKMLENLPFPPELARVPRYASTHHETLKGTGYPRKLTGDQLSIPERILVLADIFEALTAADRPYKKAKPLSVAIDILHKMSLDEHIDIEVFNLFLTSGLYLEYAHKFLTPEQIDEVDISRYL